MPQNIDRLLDDQENDKLSSFSSKSDSSLALFSRNRSFAVHVVAPEQQNVSDNYNMITNETHPDENTNQNIEPPIDTVAKSLTSFSWLTQRYQFCFPTKVSLLFPLLSLILAGALIGVCVGIAGLKRDLKAEESEYLQKHSKSNGVIQELRRIQSKDNATIENFFKQTKDLDERQRKRVSPVS